MTGAFHSLATNCGNFRSFASGGMASWMACSKVKSSDSSRPPIQLLAVCANERSWSADIRRRVATFTFTARGFVLAFALESASTTVAVHGVCQLVSCLGTGKPHVENSHGKKNVKQACEHICEPEFCRETLHGVILRDCNFAAGALRTLSRPRMQRHPLYVRGCILL